MNYRSFIEALRELSCYVSSEPSSESIKDILMQLNLADIELQQKISDFHVEECPKVSLVHKEQGFELRLLQTGKDFNCNIHDHPQKDVHGLVLRDNISIKTYHLKEKNKNLKYKLQKISEDQHSEGQYFFIGRDENNFHSLQSDNCSLALELILPASLNSMKAANYYEVESEISEDLFWVNIKEEEGISVAK